MAAVLSYSLGATALPAASPRPPKIAGDLTLDAAAPLIDVTIAGVPLRLRVDLTRGEAIELNPGAAARLPLAWAADGPVEVGRIRLAGRIAIAPLRVGAAEWPVQVAERGRDCCTGADGAIGPDLLRYATVRWRRTDAPAATGERTLILDRDDMTGLSAAAEPGVRVRFALDQAATSGTAAAGAILARAWSGRWDGSPMRIMAAYGIERPARPIAFGFAGRIAGFRLPRLLVRTADFGGGAALPNDPVDPGDIVVKRRLTRQQAWAAVTLGTDRLSRCAEIVYTAQPRSLTLRCAFD